ncbi:mucin-binding protein, partial [Streptococcus oralis]|uniref:mucin-binding protein n=1 Tax=Streptococcus oralis TaxID=1303 RepID=UPI001CC13F92
MDKNARRRLHRASAEKRLRYSVRKFNVGVASVAVAAFMFLGGNAVAANTLAKTDSPSTSTEKTGTVPDSEGKSGPDTSKSTAESVVSSEAPSSQVADKAVKSEATSKSEAALKEATSQVSEASVANSQSATSVAKSEATSEATSTASSSETVAQSTAVESGKSSIENVTSKAASLATTSQTSTAIARSEANSTLAAAQREVDKGYADFRKSGESGFRSFDPQTGKTTVTKENFLDYFRLNGSATYNSYDGIVTLTPDENSKTGNFSLKSKINMNQSFKLTGEVNLGSKTQERYGADGIGFAFHTGNTTDLGADGGNLGIGGLRNATGFKLDTFWNVHTPPKGNRFDTNNTDSFQYGWAEDPRLGQFGAWVNTTHKKVRGQGWFADEYDRWWAETDASSAQRLDSSDLDGRFHRFAIDYNGTTKELTIAYESNLGIKQWKKKVSTPEEIMSMVVTATTGNYKNLQQFQIKRFDFYQSASVDVRYEDEQGRELAEGTVTYPQGAYKGKAYTTEQKKINGYGFIGMKRGSLPPSGTLADWGTNGTVTYVYRRGAADVKTEKQTVTRKIEYRYRDGQTAGRPALPQTVTQTAEFTRTVTGGRPGPWSPSSQNLAAVNTPSITGFTPDKTRVDGITVNAGSTPGTEIVYYEKIAPRVTTETKDVTRTVAYEYEDGVTSGRPALPREVQQNVQFTRQVSEDPVTGQKTYGNWTPTRQTVPAVDTPAIKGFTPNKTRVNSATVSPTDPSWREIVSYRKNDPKVTTETKDVTRTIAYEYEDGVTRNRPALPQPVEQTVQFTRQVSEDPVTGQKTYGNWTPSRQNVVAVDSPEVSGFTPNKARVNSASVGPNDPSWREIVSYAPATQRGTIVYRTDGKNGVPAKTLHTDNVSGKSDTPVNYTTTAKINEFKQQGYDLVSDGFTKAGGQRFDSNNNVDQTWEVVLTPRIETKQETKTVTRNVRYQYKDGVTAGRPTLPQNVTQTTTFTRPISVNKVTGVETPGAWNKNTENLPKVDSPAVTGFTPDKPSVPATSVTPTSPNVDEVVNYSQDEQRGRIEYVTDGQNGVPVKTLYTDSVTGKSGENVDYTTTARIEQLKQAGYKLVSDGFTQPNGQKFDTDKTQDQVWKVVVTPIIETRSETKRVLRTIEYQYGDGVTAGRPALPPTVTQPATFNRQVSVNKATGVETPGAWSRRSGTLPEVTSPAITGFTPDRASVPTITVTPASPDSTEVVKYNLDEQRGSIKYVTDGKNGVPVKTLYTDSVTGKSGEPVAYSTVARIEQLKQAGYTLVSDGFTQPNGQTFDKDKTQDQTWTVVVTPRLDDNTNPAKLNSKVTRTIKYQYADGQTAGRPALKAPVTQEAAFTRT